MVLKRRVEKSLVLNYEKCLFMVEEGIVGHVVSERGIEVVKDKMDISKNYHIKLQSSNYEDSLGTLVSIEDL